MDDRYNTMNGFVYDKKYGCHLDINDTSVRLNELSLRVEKLKSQKECFILSEMDKKQTINELREEIAILDEYKLAQKYKKEGY